jgi:hypothetical protein
MVSGLGSALGAGAMRRWRLAGAGPLKKAPAVLGFTMVLKAKIGVTLWLFNIAMEHGP